MRWCTYSTADAAPRAALVEGDAVRGLAGPATLIEVLRSPETVAAAHASAGPTPRNTLRSAGAAARARPGPAGYPGLAPGDVVTLAVEHIGRITARVTA
ncbi:MAG: hypothetical protein ACRDP5_01965 [Streptosporangiaceae bacterium]